MLLFGVLCMLGSCFYLLVVLLIPSNQNSLATAEEGDYTDHPPSPAHAPENMSGEGDVSSSVPEYNENKQENALFSGGHQYSVVHTSPNYSFGIVPPILSPFENSESQAREVSRLPSFVVSIQHLLFFNICFSIDMSISYSNLISFSIVYM